MTADLNPEHRHWLVAERGISPAVVADMGLYSVARGLDGQAERSSAGRVVAFPFFARGEEVNTKYRRTDRKEMYQRKGGVKCFYNRDAIRLAAEADMPLVITEGEIDCMSVKTAGYPYVISVPDGAPPARDKNGRLIDVPETAHDIDVENDLKFGFLQEAWDDMARVKRIIIASDADEPGERLGKELVRRLGRTRCYFVDMEGHKDFNDVLLAEGGDTVIRIIHAAKPFPVSGIYAIADLPEEAPMEMATTPWPRVTEIFKPTCPSLTVVSGFANHGKSAWTNQLVGHLIARHRWPVAIASLEMRPKVVVRQLEKAVQEALGPTLGSKFDQIGKAQQIVQNHAYIIAPNPDTAEATTIEWFLDKAMTAVVRYGVKVLVLDPWNEIEHVRGKDESLTEYTGRALREFRRFCWNYGVCGIIVAHPSKGAISKDPEDLTLYDISDSAHWANKPDAGVIVARLGNLETDNMTGVMVRKIRYQPECGVIGHAELVFDRETRTFH